MTDKVLNAADTPEHSRLRNEYKALLDGMRGEISVIKEVQADIVESFNDYRLLKRRTDRADTSVRCLAFWAT